MTNLVSMTPVERQQLDLCKFLEEDPLAFIMNNNMNNNGDDNLINTIIDTTSTSNIDDDYFDDNDNDSVVHHHQNKQEQVVENHDDNYENMFDDVEALPCLPYIIELLDSDSDEIPERQDKGDKIMHDVEWTGDRVTCSDDSDNDENKINDTDTDGDNDDANDNDDENRDGDGWKIGPILAQNGTKITMGINSLQWWVDGQWRNQAGHDRALWTDGIGSSTVVYGV